MGQEKLSDRSKQPSSRDRLLDSGELLFSQRGLGGVGLAEIAAGAGLSKAAMFHHFPTKSHLYCEVMARVLVKLELDLLRALAAGGQATARLDRWIDQLLDTLAEHPPYAALLLRVLVDDAELVPDIPAGTDATEAVGRIVAAAVQVLRDGMDTGEFISNSPSMVLQSLIGAVLHPLATNRFGEEWMGDDLFSEAQISRRKTALKKLMHHGLITAAPAVAQKETDR